MFNRAEYKRAALQDLRGKWKTAALVEAAVLAIFLLTQVPSALGGKEEATLALLPTLLSLLSLAIQGVIEIAMIFFFLRLATDKDNTSFSTFIDGLNLWLRGMLGSLWSNLWIFLWSLLFVIPGLVKTYAYSQMMYILAEHPAMSVRKALELSKAMTKGYKGDLFLLDLSFSGWGILCLLTGGIGVSVCIEGTSNAGILCLVVAGIGLIFLIPYYMSASVHAHRFLKSQALSTGVLQEADFSDRF